MREFWNSQTNKSKLKNTDLTGTTGEKLCSTYLHEPSYRSGDLVGAPGAPESVRDGGGVAVEIEDGGRRGGGGGGKWLGWCVG
jgi:hypothetical protein